MVMTKANCFNRVNFLAVSLSGRAFIGVLDATSKFHILNLEGQ